MNYFNLSSARIERYIQTGLFLFIIFIGIRSQVCRESYIKVYPLSQDHFERVYLIYQDNNTYFLNLQCKRPNILSISITQNRIFTQAPRFNIYGKHHPKEDSIQSKRSIFKECHVEIQVSSANFVLVKRKYTNLAIFSICDINITTGFKKVTVLDDSVKWGLGQRFQERFQLTDGDWTIWNRDRPWEIDHGRKYQSGQTYGHQPVYLAREFSRNLFHLVYFKNHHGILVQSSQLGTQLVFNTVGGNIQFLVLIGQQDPQECIEKYHEFIGKSHIPPFWSFGYHQSRWGYKSLAQVEEVIQNFHLFDIPLDTFWLDLDYMKNKMIFTLDEIAFPAYQLNSLLTRQNLKFVPLLDVQISVKDHQAITLGKKMDVFLKSHLKDQYYYRGQVWPGEVYYIDYLHPNATQYWQIQLKRLNNKINFSGIWLDMNEPTNFRRQSDPFYPIQIQKDESISIMTINVKLKHYQENLKQTPLTHGQVHSYYGHLSTIPTFDYLSKQGRPFIVTRSNSVGTGVFAAHWTGDNVANWQFLKSSINSNFLFQIFGIQMIGSDICGFYKDTNQQLCSRWMQLGSFYPFARNHNHQHAKPQEPYMFGPDHIQTSRVSLKTRYALLKQMYTWLIMKRGKGSFFRPVGFQFYQDQTTFSQFVMETQFLVGKSVMVAPILEPQTDQRVVYFPGEGQTWFQFQIDSEVGCIVIEKVKKRNHQWIYNVKNALPNPPLTFLRSGYLILTNYPQNRSNKLKKQFFMFAALKKHTSKGQIIAIQDYQDNYGIQKCIKQTCLSFLTLSRLPQNKFSLLWSYTGDPDIFSYYTIKRFIITTNDLICNIDQQVIISQNGFLVLQDPQECSKIK